MLRMKLGSMHARLCLQDEKNCYLAAVGVPLRVGLGWPLVTIVAGQLAWKDGAIQPEVRDQELTFNA
jgi:hypothetical protein